jgi:nitroreductase
MPRQPAPGIPSSLRARQRDQRDPALRWLEERANAAALMLDIFGNRGYRALNVEVGLVAQSIYLTATALSIGCGAALGFDQSALTKALGLDGSDLRAQLALIVGHERPNRAGFDYSLV